MITVDRQLHGYRQGHQLLASSVTLPKVDQSVIDWLSDAAGSLRPQERFEPYLAAYPLPSGTRYVLARTWQDLTVPRSGCVRTLSLIIDITEWSSAASLAPLIELLEVDGLPNLSDATQRAVSTVATTLFPPVTDFNARELLEALFLEEAKPVVVFDAPSPDLIALRLLSALWPSMRQKFALSTFARSPRKISGRNFDLVFAPKDARGKFSGWEGRRIDGRATGDARHHWTSAIVKRVFEQPSPRLLTSSEIELFGVDGDTDDAKMLRIALLWGELFEKLDRTPTAALGLLDIVNSGKVLDTGAIASLDLTLAHSILQASTTLPKSDAWPFLGAVAAKAQARPMMKTKDAVATATANLAGNEPTGAVAFLSEPERREVWPHLLPQIARGLGEAANGHSELALRSASPDLLLDLLAADGQLARRAAADNELVGQIGRALECAETTLADKVWPVLLPHLVEDWQLPAASPLIKRLSGEELAGEITHLNAANGLGAIQFAKLVVDHACAIGATEYAREALIALTPSEGRDALLGRTLGPTFADVNWLLNTPKLSRNTAAALLISLLRTTNQPQLSEILHQPSLRAKVLDILKAVDELDLLERAIFAADLPINEFVDLVRTLFARTNSTTSIDIAGAALDRCLPVSFADDQNNFIVTALDILGEQVQAAQNIRAGLARGVPGSIASRNLIAFCNASKPARRRIVGKISVLAQTISGRSKVDLNAGAWKACAELVSEAGKDSPQEQLDAAARLLPILMQNPKRPVSSMIIVVFPVIYRELAAKDEVTDFLKLVPLLDWDRRKAARKELVIAFLSSSWPPTDLALTACRCGDPDRILGRLAKSSKGRDYLARIESEAGALPLECRSIVERTIERVKP